MNPFIWIVVVVIVILLISLKQINQYERGVKFTMGRYTRIMEPGWRIVIPIFQSYRKVDILLQYYYEVIKNYKGIIKWQKKN